MAKRRFDIVALLSSVKLALVLIIALTSASIAGSVGVKNVFSSWWFIALGLAFFINTLFCTCQKVVKAYRLFVTYRRGEGNPPAEAAGRWSAQERVEPDQLVSAATRLLRKRRYIVQETASGRSIVVWGRKNGYGRWGASIFHVGLLIVIIGGLITLSTKFWGSFVVLEGGTFVDKHEKYVYTQKGLWAPEEHRYFEVKLEKVNLHVRPNGELHDYMAEITIFENGKPVQRGLVSGPTPVYYKEIIIYKRLWGYAPGMMLTWKDGRKVPFRWVLDTTIHEDHFTHLGTTYLPGTDYLATASFFPDLQGTPDKPQNGSYEPKNPAVFLNIVRQGKAVYTGPLLVGKSIDLGDVILSFDNYKNWYGFSMVKDRGIPVVFFGFWFSTLGLAVLYLLVPKDIAVRIASADGVTNAHGVAPINGPAPGAGRLVVEVCGRTAKFRSLFREDMDRFARDLAREMKLRPLAKDDTPVARSATVPEAQREAAAAAKEVE